MKNLDLNTYMYAPKDDSKHRKLWREKYTSSEKEVLSTLIKHCKSQGIEFVYAISPGLDIVFSSPADVNAMKGKLEQVYGLGCRSYALLFDDIDPELCLADKSEFSSFGTAQVHVSNLLFEWFNELKLVMFCPTEYCITRAKPNVEESEYLKCLGDKLHEKIHIMWTGPKVVSKTIDTKSINALVKVLKRKPVIWDNIHANDYDQRRVFLGPFKGRPMELYESTSGILTNPNCEFECNFIAIHSLSTWLRVARIYAEENKSVNEDSNGSSCNSSVASGSTNNQDLSLLYDSKLALYDAVDCWLELFQLPRETIQGSRVHANKVSLDTVINSLVDDELVEKVNGKVNGVDDNEEKIDDKVEENGQLEKENLKKDENKESTDDASPEKKAKQSQQLTTDDVLLLCDLFHLPYEHGERGVELIEEFKWLKENAINYSLPICPQKIEEWHECSKQFQIKCQYVEDMYKRFMEICNKRILEQLFPYLHDIKETVYHLSKYVKWLGSVKRQNGSDFLPADPEAWFYRGGIAEEIERLLPTPYDKVAQPSSDNQKQTICVLRPFLDEDKEVLFELCRNLSAVPEAYENCSELAGDSLIGAYLKFSTGNVFVIDADDEISGFIGAHYNGGEFYEKVKKEWLPNLSKQYKKPDGDPDVWSPYQHMVNRLYYPKFFSPEELFNEYPAIMTLRLSPKVLNPSICRQALKCIRSSIKTNMCCQIKKSLNSQYEPLLNELGFQPIASLKDQPTDIIIYGSKK